MQITAVSNQATLRSEPLKPQAPTPPPGGNVGNRQPPPKPTKPVATLAGGSISIYV